MWVAQEAIAIQEALRRIEREEELLAQNVVGTLTEGARGGMPPSERAARQADPCKPTANGDTGECGPWPIHQAAKRPRWYAPSRCAGDAAPARPCARDCC